jgi:hypothetical protein
LSQCPDHEPCDVCGTLFAMKIGGFFCETVFLISLLLLGVSMNFRSDRGSALVLTLLFILLLSTMSTVMYQYAARQSMFANAQYTTVAASYVADAGLEHGKALLATWDPKLNEYGKNPGDGTITPEDFPVIFPMSPPFGQQTHGEDGERLTDGRQGIGNYSVRIDAAYSDDIFFDIELRRNPGFDPLDLMFGNPGRINRLLPGKALQLQIRKDLDVLNAFNYHFQNPDILLEQDFSEMSYRIEMSNVVNPYLGKDIFLELNRTSIPADSPVDTFDAWGNPVVLYPNNHHPNNHQQHIDSDKADVNALFFIPAIGNDFSTNMVHVFNVDPDMQNDVEVTIWYLDSATGFYEIDSIIPSFSWGPDINYRAALLDFSPDGEQKEWRRDDTHDLSTTGITTDEHAMILEVNGSLDHGGIYLSVTRGMNESMDVGVRMRSKSMDENCWYPDFPNCPGGGGYNVVMTLPPQTPGSGNDNVYYNLTSDLRGLHYKARTRVNELYIITSSGNVENATETRSVLTTPVSFLDYARFTQGDLSFGPLAMTSGKTYSQRNIEMPDPGHAFFYDDVMASGIVSNPGNAVFPLDGGIKQNMPVVDIPRDTEIDNYLTSNASNAWVIGTPFSNQHYDLFLGNYDYVRTESSDTFWGFDFSGPNPVYYQPTPDILTSDNFSYRESWIPSSLGPPTTPLPDDFNGLIIVNGHVHVWGKLHGRSLTILARGNIIIEREILMGTDELNVLSPGGSISTNKGMPVNLALIPFRSDVFGSYYGDILLSENCPRIMKIEAALMPFAGTLRMEDVDSIPPSGFADDIDLDNSHKYAGVVWDSVNNRFNWIYSDTPPARFDLNDDGRFSDGRDYAMHELPRIELGEWNEKHIRQQDYLWYFMLQGTYLDRDGTGPAHFAARGEYPAPPGGPPPPDDYRNGITRNYRHNPSMRINPPPFVPMPKSSLKILERDHAIYF